MLGLHISHSILESIEVNFPQDIDRQKRELVKKWMSSSKQLPCWWHLVNALEKIKMGALAEELKEKHSEVFCTSIIIIYNNFYRCSYSAAREATGEKVQYT